MKIKFSFDKMIGTSKLTDIVETISCLISIILSKVFGLQYLSMYHGFVNMPPDIANMTPY